MNRLNKTKVEKHPDLKQEKDDRQRELRRRDQASQQARVRQAGVFFCLLFSAASLLISRRKKRKPALLRSARSSSTARTTRTTTCSRRTTWSPRATRTGTRTGKTISCRRETAGTFGIYGIFANNVTAAFVFWTLSLSRFFFAHVLLKTGMDDRWECRCQGSSRKQRDR